MSRSRLRLLAGTMACAAAAALSGFGVGTAHAQAKVEHLTPPQLFAAADLARASGRVADALAMYDALARDPDPEVRAEARFRRGMTLAGIGRYREAAESFRALLDEKPKAARARLELARMDALLGDEKAARRELRQAQAGGLPPEVALTVDQFAAAIRSTRRFGGSVEVALAPDTNVNRATGARTLDTVIAPFLLSDDARAKSGLGIQAGGQIYARLPVSGSVSLLPRLSMSGRFYRASRFDDLSLSALAGVEWTKGVNRLTASVGPGWRWYGLSKYARTQTVSLDWIRAAGPRTQIVAGATAGRARYARLPLQDGSIYDISLSVEHALSPGMGGALTLFGNRQTARDRGYATATGGVSALGWREFGRMTVYLSGAVRRTEADARLVLFSERRRDWLMQAAAGATFRQISALGLAPMLRASFERSRSSVGLYEYKRLSAEVGLTRAF
jgi:hypothetical protein